MQTNRLKPSRTIVTSFNPRKAVPAVDQNDADVSPYEEGEWVLCLAASKNTLACALSNGEVQVYDQERLHVTQSFPCYSSSPATITSLMYAPNTNHEPILISTDSSGCLAVMDLRSGQRTVRMTLPSPALCLGLGYEEGHLAAVGSVRGRIHFTDLRQPGSLLGSYIDSHTDDVTQVTFSPYQSAILLSGAEDGLVSLFDTTQPTEETARKAVCSVGTAVRHAGFCGPNNLYCLTGSETLSLWHAESATVVRDFGLETRSHLSRQLLSGGPTATVDYLVDAHWNEATQQLLLLAGTSVGDAALFSLGGKHQQQQPTLEFRAECVLQGGHRGIVRAWTPLLQSADGAVSTFMTAGEDARLCEWRPTPTFAAPIPPSPAAKRVNGGGGPMRRRQRSKPSASPY